MSSSAKRIAATSPSRFTRSRSRHRLSRALIAGGTVGGSALQSGFFVNSSASVSVVPSPSNRRRPVNISYSTHPNAQMSVRLSTACPRACSGLM